MAKECTSCKAWTITSNRHFPLSQLFSSFLNFIPAQSQQSVSWLSQSAAVHRGAVYFEMQQDAHYEPFLLDTHNDIIPSVTATRATVRQMWPLVFPLLLPFQRVLYFIMNSRASHSWTGTINCGLKNIPGRKPWHLPSCRCVSMLQVLSRWLQISLLPKQLHRLTSIRSGRCGRPRGRWAHPNKRSVYCRVIL